MLIFALSIAKALGISDGLHIFREDGNLTLEEIPDDITKLNKWIKVAVLRSISPFPSAAKDIFSSGIHDILFLIDAQTGIISKLEIIFNTVLGENWISELAELLRGKIAVASIDRENEESSHALEFFSATEGSDSKAAIRIFNDEKRKQYWYACCLNFIRTFSGWKEK